jgi:RimJ/RimL family protein N-acetyltransferase
MRTLSPLSLHGRAVRLEPLAIEHAPLLDAASSGPRGTFSLTFVPDGATEALDYVEVALAERARGESLPFVVKDAEGSVVGSTRFMHIEWWPWRSAPPEPRPDGPDAVEIGCTWYAERAQRTALNTEAKLLLCTHAFETWGVRRVTFRTDARNERSRTAIARIGARFDGVLRAHRPASDGVVRDTACFSLLRGEWPAAKEALERRLSR